MGAKDQFKFQISLSVLNHLGRNLYRSFGTVLGEAISNAWDADASNVWIYVSKNKRELWIKDDGVGMSAKDFQDKFLRIGYSKRRNGDSHSDKGRPYIGRKGIGKLALLSCAERITIASKLRGKKYVGGVIDNGGLDTAITDDLTPSEYSLLALNSKALAKYTRGHTQGTIIRFESINDGVSQSLKSLGKIIALYFRFSLHDKSFKIFLNDEQITHENLKDLIEKTEFLWQVGSFRDPYVDNLKASFATKRGRFEKKKISIAENIYGFIASVTKPRDLKVLGTEERIGVDLFVNGRLRERDILKHMPTAQVPESYMYGQVHFDKLDDAKDRFTSSREGIVADDPKYRLFLEKLRSTLLKIVEDWDRWRLKHREKGDQENDRLSKTARASVDLYNAVAKEYEPEQRSQSADKVDGWVSTLSKDATFNFESYAECFISENLVRKYIKDRRIKLSPEAISQIKDYRQREDRSKKKANISIELRKGQSELSYLDMRDLAALVDKVRSEVEAGLSRDADQFKPIRDALAHTALLSNEAKAKLKTVRDNIKARVKNLLSTTE